MQNAYNADIGSPLEKTLCGLLLVVGVDLTTVKTHDQKGEIGRYEYRRFHMKKLYLVYGNTWFGGYGEEIHIFGVFSSRKMAEKVKKQAEDEYFEQDQQSRFTELNDRSEVEFYIVEIPEDTRIDEKLGGYIE